MSWPLMWRSTNERQLAAALMRVQKAEDSARQRLDEQAAKHAVQLDEAAGTVQRLDGRNRALSEQLETAQAKTGFDKGRAEMTARRLARMQRAVAAARADAAKARRTARAGFAGEFHRSEKARASLDEQARTLQASNEAMTRELYDLRHGGAS